LQKFTIFEYQIPALNYVNLNGKVWQGNEIALPYDNSAFRYGYGLFETMLVEQGTVALWHYHSERLFEGIRQLDFDIPVLFTPDVLQEEIKRTVKKNQLEKLCRVRLQVYAGRGGMFDNDQKSGYIIECFPLDRHITELNETGLVTGIAKGLFKSADSLSNMKTSNALIYAVAARYAKANKWNDALILNTSGNIIESTIANIFWIKGREIYSPPLIEGCIAGAMRRHLLEVLPQYGYTIHEAPLTVSTLKSADAVFLTNAIRKIKWIHTIDDKEYGIDMIPAIYRAISG
jgi:branched-chain amino acid aminotransferase